MAIGIGFFGSVNPDNIASGSYGIRPVVKLPYTHINLKGGYNEETGWSLKQ